MYSQYQSKKESVQSIKMYKENYFMSKKSCPFLNHYIRPDKASWTKERDTVNRCKKRKYTANFNTKRNFNKGNKNVNLNPSPLWGGGDEI